MNDIAIIQEVWKPSTHENTTFKPYNLKSKKIKQKAIENEGDNYNIRLHGAYKAKGRIGAGHILCMKIGKL